MNIKIVEVIFFGGKLLHEAKFAEAGTRGHMLASVASRSVHFGHLAI